MLRLRIVVRLLRNQLLHDIALLPRHLRQELPQKPLHHRLGKRAALQKNLADRKHFLRLQPLGTLTRDAIATRPFIVDDLKIRLLPRKILAQPLCGFL